ncbi:hypothetical protein AALP_AA2G179100 [Arabis alpina]|uniref:Uncharacterized protein n=1 Tax=Arabis alpina TaxID=50452 RepID=A0A087HI99_ARAAL|nr:hypothetical protein AALP_AA2G179100 [Arabis alpina]
MSSESSASVKLDRKWVRIVPDVTLARSSDHMLDASIPTGVPLTGPSDRRLSDASSPEVELPVHRPEVVSLWETRPSISRPVLRDSTEEGSSYARPETSSGRSEPLDRVETNEGTSGGDKGIFVNFRNAAPKSPGPGLGHWIKLDDSNNVAWTMRSSLVYALSPASRWKGISIIYPQANDRPWSPLSGYMCVRTREEKNSEGLRGGGKHISQVPSACLQFVRCMRRGPDFLSSPRDDSSPSDSEVWFAIFAISMLDGYNFFFDAWYALDQNNRKLNTQNGELVAESNRSLEARREAELEVTKFKDLLDHSHRMNGDLIAEQDELNSKVAAMTLALAEAEEVKRSEVSRIEGEVANLKSSSKDASSDQGRPPRFVTRQVVGAIKRMDKAAKEGVPIDAANKEKLEARLAAYTAETDQIIIPPLRVDSSDDEGIEPIRNVALDISSTDSSDDEVERTEADGRITVVGKTLALSRVEIEDAANGEAHDGADQLELQGGDVKDNTEPIGTQEVGATADLSATEAVDAAIGEPIASHFSLPDLTSED